MMLYGERLIGWCEGSRAAVQPVLGVRTRLSLYAGLLALCAVFLAVLSSPARAAGCQNEEIRHEQGAAAEALPECRAYELVTPAGTAPALQNTGPTNDNGFGLVEAAASAAGGAVILNLWYSPTSAPSEGDIFIARRGVEGWSTRALAPSFGPTLRVGACAEHMYFTADLSDVVLPTDSGPGATSEGGCEEDEPPLASGEPRGVGNLFVRYGEGAPFELISSAPVEGAAARPRFQADGDEMRRIVFDDPAKLTVNAPGGGADDLYEWSAEGLRLVTYTPSGTPVQGTLAGGADEIQGTEFSPLTQFGAAPAMLSRSVSSDGERVVFNAGGRLFERVNATWPQSQVAAAPLGEKVNGEQCTEPEDACTVQLDASRGPGASGGGLFLGASANGLRVFFSDQSRLTSESTAASGKPDLYEYDLETGVLSDLTVSAGERADVQGVMGVSEDGLYVYVVAEGALPGSKSPLGSPVAKHPNLYLLHEGTVSFIAPLSPEDAKDWGESSADGERTVTSESGISSLISRDGQTLLFNSTMRITGYENLPPAQEPSDCLSARGNNPGSPCNEIFRFDAADGGSVVCVSCGAPGSAPAGLAELRVTSGTYARRALVSNGDVFFDTPSKLLPQDTNGVSDVYEWSPPGAGECTAESVSYDTESDGCLYSLSSGKSPEPSYFVDASENGEDVYFATAQSLVAADTDNALSLYDARVGGGYPSSVEATQTPVCRGVEECRTAVGEAPAVRYPASMSFSGPGNLAQPQSSSRPVVKQPIVKPKPKSCGKGFVLRRGKCVRRKVERRRQAGSRKRVRRAVRGGGRRG